MLSLRPIRFCDLDWNISAHDSRLLIDEICFLTNQLNEI